MNHRNVLLTGLLAAFISGCASNSVPDPDAESESMDSSANTGTYDGGAPGRGESFSEGSPGELASVVYFDYDQATLRPEYVDLLARHAGRMADGAQITVRLEGHADERGSREYNIGLGERRSQTVRSILLANGVSGEQLSTTSFGEERPAVTGSDDQSYAMNRRVEINYVD